MELEKWFKALLRNKVFLSILLILDLIVLVITLTMNGWFFFFIALFVLMGLLSQLGNADMYKSKERRLNQRVRYRIHHCDLEVSIYSSKIRYFNEETHPMDELLDIDYVASYKRHYLKASLNEEAFIYHEEVLLPKRSIPVTNMFQGYVIEFVLDVPLKKKFTINHPLLNDQYVRNFVYTNGLLMRVYIPNRRFISQITEKDDVEEEIKELTNHIREIIKFKNEFLSTYKENENERTE